MTFDHQRHERLTDIASIFHTDAFTRSYNSLHQTYVKLAELNQEPGRRDPRYQHILDMLAFTMDGLHVLTSPLLDEANATHFQAEVKDATREFGWLIQFFQTRMDELKQLKSAGDIPQTSDLSALSTLTSELTEFMRVANGGPARPIKPIDKPNFGIG